MKKIPYYNKETPFEIKSEEDWKKVKCCWWVSYNCNICGKKHIKLVKNLKYAKNTCFDGTYRNKETPFEIKCEEDWKKVKGEWWVSYICNTCGERHIKMISGSNKKNTCILVVPYRNKETPFEIKSEEDWKKVKNQWYVSYICNKCGELHVKKVNVLNLKNTCILQPHTHKETPFEIKSEEDWKKVKGGWYVSYICNTCGKRHIKLARESKNVKNTCFEGTYRNKETPFEIKSKEDWKMVKLGWYVSYICDKCGERHVKIVQNIKHATCFGNAYHRNKETPFEIKSKEDWKMVKLGWYVSYICNTCGERHIKRVNESKYAKNTCINKTKNIKINYHSNYVDSFIFAF